MKKTDQFLRGRSLIAVIFSLLLLTLFNGCKKDKLESPISSEDSIYVVIDEIMNSWYLWYKEVPDVDIFQYNEPADLLGALVYKPIDKWSFIEDKAVIDAIFQDGESYGFGFTIRFDPDGNLRILYVYENTEAYNLGLRKGYIIKSINGTSVKDYQDYESFFDSNPATFTFEITDFDGITSEVSLSKATIQQNGVFYKNIYNVSGKQTGYLVYDSFLGYTATELDEAFEYFKQNNITELIVDLRYNSGGYISLAEQFANMAAPLTTAGHTMYSRIHNDIVGPTYDSTTNFATHELNLNLDRIFFLTTRFTASASELVINVLDPYMDVYLIGTPTTGKPVGMYGFLFHDWYIYPVTIQLENANGYGDFYNGLPVDFTAGEGLDKDWGDETDPCLSQAFHYISFGEFDTKAAYDLKLSKSVDIPFSQKHGRDLLIMDR